MKNKLRDKIKQDMIDLQNRLDKLNFWEESGYANKPCLECEWTLMYHQAMDTSRPLLATPTVIDDTMSLKYLCKVCGLTKERIFKIDNETLYDEWAEYREGGEEE
jgi:hypothetical protein